MNESRGIAGWMVELLAGGSAAILLVLLLFVLRLDLWLVLSLAALDYAGLRLALRRAWRQPEADGAADDPQIEACQTKVAQLRQIAIQLSEPHQRAARQQVAAIHELAASILVGIEQDPSKRDMLPRFLTDHLVPIHTLLRQYAHVSGLGLKSAHETLAQTETEILPKAEQSLREFYERLHANEIVDLAVANEMLDQTA